MRSFTCRFTEETCVHRACREGVICIERRLDQERAVEAELKNQSRLGAQRRQAAERTLFELASEHSQALGRVIKLPLSEREDQIDIILTRDRHAERLARHLRDVLAGIPAQFDHRQNRVDNVAIEIDVIPGLLQ